MRIPVSIQEPLKTTNSPGHVYTVNANGLGDGSLVTLTRTVPPNRRWIVHSIVWRNSWNADTDQYLSFGIVTNEPSANVAFLHYFAPFVANGLYTGCGAIGGTDNTITFSDGAQAFSETVIPLPAIALDEGWRFEFKAFNCGAASTYNLYVTYEEVFI